jgi:hypothetical protein
MCAADVAQLDLVERRSGLHSMSTMDQTVPAVERSRQAYRPPQTCATSNCGAANFAAWFWTVCTWVRRRSAYLLCNPRTLFRAFSHALVLIGDIKHRALRDWVHHLRCKPAKRFRSFSPLFRPVRHCGQPYSGPPVRRYTPTSGHPNSSGLDFRWPRQPPPVKEPRACVRHAGLVMDAAATPQLHADPERSQPGQVRVLSRAAAPLPLLLRSEHVAIWQRPRGSALGRRHACPLACGAG